MKKKIVALLISAIVACAALVAPAASATTKADLLALGRTSPAYPYVALQVESVAKVVPCSDEQAGLILPILQEAMAVVTEDHGPTPDTADGSPYTREQVDRVMNCIDRIFAILNLRYEWSAAATQLHEGDFVFNVYDDNGNLVFLYNGDYLLEGAGSGSGMLKPGDPGYVGPGSSIVANTSGDVNNNASNTDIAIVCLASAVIVTFAAVGLHIVLRKKPETEIEV